MSRLERRLQQLEDQIYGKVYQHEDLINRKPMIEEYNYLLAISEAIKDQG